MLGSCENPLRATKELRKNGCFPNESFKILFCDLHSSLGILFSWSLKNWLLHSSYLNYWNKWTIIICYASASKLFLLRSITLSYLNYKTHAVSRFYACLKFWKPRILENNRFSSVKNVPFHILKLMTSLWLIFLKTISFENVFIRL